LFQSGKTDAHTFGGNWVNGAGCRLKRIVGIASSRWNHGVSSGWLICEQEIRLGISYLDGD
jgi:hypothetical protein